MSAEIHQISNLSIKTYEKKFIWTINNFRYFPWVDNDMSERLFLRSKDIIFEEIGLKMWLNFNPNCGFKFVTDGDLKPNTSIHVNANVPIQTTVQKKFRFSGFNYSAMSEFCFTIKCVVFEDKGDETKSSSQNVVEKATEDSVKVSSNNEASDVKAVAKPDLNETNDRQDSSDEDFMLVGSEESVAKKASGKSDETVQLVMAVQDGLEAAAKSIEIDLRAQIDVVQKMLKSKDDELKKYAAELEAKNETIQNLNHILGLNVDTIMRMSREMKILEHEISSKNPESASKNTEIDDVCNRYTF